MTNFEKHFAKFEIVLTGFEKSLTKFEIGFSKFEKHLTKFETRFSDFYLMREQLDLQALDNFIAASATKNV